MEYFLVLYAIIAIGFLWYATCMNLVLKHRNHLRKAILEIKPEPGEDYFECHRRRMGALAIINHVPMGKHAWRLFFFREWQSLYG